uniref:M48 family metallopeptidase n=1 Tax=Campylobacter fetus TaxID=196 RepID=UPI0021D52E03|nr:M48 family metallopeptidase [Campylobacter fetus]
MLENILIVKKDVKNITLKVKPTGEVVLTTPKAVSDEYTEYIIKKRAKWIEQKKNFSRRFKPIKKSM